MVGVVLTQGVANSYSSVLGVEFWMSLAALVISIVTATFEFVWNERINRTNLESDFFKEIYGHYIMKDIPKARKTIRYNNEILSDTGDLSDLLNEIRQESLFYLYEDKAYYEELKDKLQKLEDELVAKENKRMEPEQYAEFVKDLNNKIENIYDIIMRKYTGRKKIRISLKRKK